MCLLILAYPNHTPKKSELNCACEVNPDGFGFAFLIDQTKIITGHSLNKNNAMKRFFKLRQKYPEAYALFHARYATTGSIKIENCHPYTIGTENKKSILAHNGMLPIRPTTGDDRSDTKIFAEDYLPEFGLQNLDDEKFFGEVEEFCAGSKLVIFTTDEKMKYNVYIINEHLGHKKNGVWYSNYSYCEIKKIDTYKQHAGTTYKTKTIYKNDYWLEDDEPEFMPNIKDTCTECFAENDYNATLCHLCGACLDCYEPIKSCLCYQPIKNNYSEQTNQWQELLY